MSKNALSDAIRALWQSGHYDHLRKPDDELRQAKNRKQYGKLLVRQAGQRNRQAVRHQFQADRLAIKHQRQQMRLIARQGRRSR